MRDEDDSQIMLARIDERVVHIDASVRDAHANLGRLEKKLDAEFVRLSRYLNIERSVFGVVGLVITLLIAYVFTKVVGHG